jgi:tetratricopeptide (TPR) repeat protein
MGALGTTELIGAGASFASEAARPTQPGARRSAAGTTHRVRGKTDGDNVATLIDGNLDLTIAAARQAVERRRSSTTLATLAQALEWTGEYASAVEAAEEALALCVANSKQGILDNASVRIALEVVFRQGEPESALAFASRLPISQHLRLAVGAVLGAKGRFKEAHSFVDGVDVPERDAVLGYLLVNEGKDQQAIAYLRSALRRHPDDADSALNLSIALWRIGSKRKALALALQAARSAPGREDIGLHYLELLLAARDFTRVESEIGSLARQGVDPSARLLVMQARAKLSLDEVAAGIRLLEKANVVAQAEGDMATVAEVRSNLVRIRAQHGKTAREDAIGQLQSMHNDFPTEPVVVANLAQVANRKHHAAIVQRAFDDVKDHCTPGRAAFLSYQIASLEGHNVQAAFHARKWLENEPDNLSACSTAIAAVGIGEELWTEAADIARKALSTNGADRSILNNAAYALAMSGEALDAIDLLSERADEEFVFKATLGLACLAADDIPRGMRLYREAAKEAEALGDFESCSLMTEYQGLVIRQLGLLESKDTSMIAALSLPSVALPDDWDQRPDFLRLHFIAEKHGYGWPLSL